MSCATCGAPTTLRFCTPQCKLFYEKVASKGLSIEHLGISKPPGTPAPPPPPTGWGRALGSIFRWGSGKPVTPGVGGGSVGMVLPIPPALLQTPSVSQEARTSRAESFLDDLTRSRAQSIVTEGVQDLSSHISRLLGMGLRVKQSETGGGSDAFTSILPLAPSFPALSTLIEKEAVSPKPSEGCSELVRRVGMLWKLGQEKSWEGGGTIRGGGGRRWTHRYFVLAGRSLAWFTTSSSEGNNGGGEGGRALGAIPLISLGPSPDALPGIVEHCAAHALATLLSSTPTLHQEGLEGLEGALGTLLESSSFSPAFFSALRQQGVTFPTLGLGVAREAGEGGGDALAIEKAVLDMVREGRLPKGVISGEGGVGGGHTPPFTLVTTPDRSLVIAGESKEDFSLWISAISELVGNEKGRLAAMVKANRQGVVQAAVALLTSPPPPPPPPPPSFLFSPIPQPMLSQSAVDTSSTALAPISSSSSAAAATNTHEEFFPVQLAGSPTQQQQPSRRPIQSLATSPTSSGSSFPLSLSLSLSLSSPTTPMAPSSALPPPTIDTPLPPAPPPTTTSSLWEIRFDEVEVVSRIGSGSCGEVYKGVYCSTPVAVKLLSNGGGGSSSDLEALKREVDILSTLRHPNVVLFLGAGLNPPAVFFVMEQCELGSLADVVYDRATPLSAMLRVSAALQAAQGMSYLHAPKRRIIHRDLKCGNLLVKRDFTVCVADFGLTVVREKEKERERERGGVEGGGAQPQQHQQQPHHHHQQGLGMGSTKGTPQWMAPELLEGSRYTESVDVYAFGIVLCELVGRIVPFSDRYTRFDFVDAVVEEGAIPTVPRWCGKYEGGKGREEEVEEEERDKDRGEEDTNSSNPIHPTLGIPRVWREDGETLGGGKVWGKGVGEAATWLPFSSPSSSPTPGGQGSSSSGSESSTTTSSTLGGVGEWEIVQGYATGALKLLIDACLSRDPQSRPTFPRLTDALRSLTELPLEDLFLQLEVPRLREALAYGDSLDTSVASCEITHLAALCELGTSAGGSTSGGGGGGEGKGGSGRSGGGGKTPKDALASSPFTLPRLTFPSHPPSTKAPYLPFSTQSPTFTSAAQCQIPPIPLPTLLLAAPQLLQGLAARLRANDGILRRDLTLPLTHPDLPTAYASAPYSPGFVVTLRSRGVGEDEGVAGLSSLRAAGVFLITFPPGEACFNTPSTTTSTTTTSTTAAATPARVSAVPPTPATATTVAAQERSKRRLAAAALAAALERRTALVSSTEHLLSSFSRLLHVMDTGLGGGWRGLEDKGEEPSLASLRDQVLPPQGSSNAHLLLAASRLAYAAATLVCTASLSVEEAGVIQRPFGGRGVGGYKCRVLTPPPPGLPVSHAAVGEAGGILRELWDRFPLLRTAIAHVLAVTLLGWVSRVGGVSIEVTLSGSPTQPFSVELGEETVAARFIGVVLYSRLNGEGEVHSLTRAVEGRVRGAEMRRDKDGVVLWCVDVEPL